MTYQFRDSSTMHKGIVILANRNDCIPYKLMCTRTLAITAELEYRCPQERMRVSV